MALRTLHPFLLAGSLKSQLVLAGRLSVAVFDAHELPRCCCFQCSLALRFLSVEVLSILLVSAGFKIEAQYGDWNRRPVAESSRVERSLRLPASRPYQARDSMSSAS